MKELNKVDLKQFVVHDIVEERSQAIVFELAEEKIMRVQEEEERARKEEIVLRSNQKGVADKQEEENIDFMQYISDPVTKLDLVQARLEVAVKGAR